MMIFYTDELFWELKRTFMYSGCLCVVCMRMCMSRVCLCTCVCIRGVSVRARVYELCVVCACVCTRVYVWVVYLCGCMCMKCVSVRARVYELCVCVCEFKLRPSDFRDLDNGEETEWDRCWNLESGLPILVGWMEGWRSGRASSPAPGGAARGRQARGCCPWGVGLLVPRERLWWSASPRPNGSGAVVFVVPAVSFWIRWSPREQRLHC